MSAIVVKNFEDWDYFLEKREHEYIVLAPPLLADENETIVFATDEASAQVLNRLDFKEANLYPLPASFAFALPTKGMLKLLRQKVNGIIITQKNRRQKTRKGAKTQ